MLIAQRDTDADWRELGATRPWFGVVSLPQFEGAALAEADLQAFYAAGEADVGHLAGLIAQHTGEPLHAARALDFGCGVGRMTGAMTAFADQVTGVDVSPAMLDAARQQVGGRATFTDALPPGPFDWINAFMVFQHIPSGRGLSLLDQLLDRLAPGGVTSLQFTVGRADALKARSRFGLTPARYDGGWRHRLQFRRAPRGSVLMFDYDLTELYERFRAHDVALATLVPTDHGGHYGVHLIGRRGAKAGLRHMPQTA